MEAKLCSIEFIDLPISLRSRFALREINCRMVSDLQILGREDFLKNKLLTYAVKLEVLNYFHLNGIFFQGENIPEKWVKLNRVKK